MTQKIRKIAQGFVKQDAKEYDFVARDPQQWEESTYQSLMEVRKALLAGRLYLRVDTVSKSGMSRTIVIKYIKGNELHGVTDHIYTLTGCDKNRRIGGCGMDMLFAAQYNLFQALCPGMRYQDKMPRYRDL